MLEYYVSFVTAMLFVHWVADFVCQTDIIGFVEWCHRKNKNIIVHCDMGVSRSGAVAKWVNEFLGLQDLYLEDYQQYNRYVFNKLCECSGVKTLKSYYKDLEENS